MPIIKNFQDTALPENVVPGVAFKELKTFPDQRGFFREIVRFNDPFFEGDGSEKCFKQWSHSKMSQNTVKAWHFHHLQIDWWYIPIGLVSVCLYDLREESPTYKRKLEFLFGESELSPDVLTAVVRIPQGVLHGCKALSDTAHLFYITSETYNPDDEGRYPYNSDVVPHSWGKDEELITAPNDRRVFLPKNPRRVLAVDWA